MQHYIKKIMTKQSLTIEEAQLAMACIMRGEATEAQIGSFITALAMKGESIEEITGCARVMRQMGETISLEGDVLDIVGTGGDGGRTFNISTLASLVVAACGVKVAKHGNRGVTSTCGSADLIEQLGINLNLTPEQNKEVFEETGACFMFAPIYHGCMRYAAKPRRELGVKSIFNLLGPLTNPASASHILLGVYDEKWAEPLAKVLCQLGIKGAMVVHGLEGLDEVSLTGVTKVCEVRDQEVFSFYLKPEDVGLRSCTLQQLEGGDLEHHLKIARAIISGQEVGPKKDAVVLNAACGLYLVGRVRSIEEGVQLAAEALRSGAVARLVLQLIEATRRKGETYVS